MKKFICLVASVLAIAVSALCFTACGAGGNDSTDGGKPSGDGDASYTVTWKDENGETVTSVKVASGTVPSYTYTKQDTAEWHYTVEGWSNSMGGEKLSVLPAVSGDATYYAVVGKTKRKYNIAWKDETGAALTQTETEYGAVPSYTYTKQDTAEWHYTVEGWSNSMGGEKLSVLPAVSGTAEYYAVVSREKRRYTVTLDSNGGGEYAPQEKEYGAAFAAPEEKPTLDGKRFLGWCTDAECKVKASFPITVTGNVTLYAAWGDVVNIKGLLSSLLGGYKLNPLSYIPDAMLPEYAANAVNADNVLKSESDYASFVNKSAMPSKGFGEQWHMVTDNLKQSQLFFNVLTAVEDISAATVTAFNNYFDKNPADTAHHEFKHGIYNVTVDCDNERIYYVLDFTSTFPVVGEQTAQIAISMDLDESNRTVRVQLGDANALAYKITENGYKFAIKYLGVRRAMFELSRAENGDVSGHINEYLTASGVTDKAVASAADFYISGNYVSAVGNKASGIPGFSGYISELYNKNTGKLLGYEVRETKSLAGKSVTFNTLWFDLSDISGISSVKYDAENKKFYVNGSSSEWTAKKVGGPSPKTASRRYDIEFRSQYFYSADGAEVEVKVPMLFVQEENYETLAADVASENSGVTVSVTLSAVYLDKIKSDYATLVDTFIANKSDVTTEEITAFIGDRVEFDAQ